ncbi:metal-dependent hydrolase [Segetibacter koreensis]|uniref:metal-dependent hydrolase n=1 Tax=Segetibacter koreensis TaxID=398037 RepID=UPI00035DA66C|nr:metal-dependent hydrolase [Segetibacter koreensis]
MFIGHFALGFAAKKINPTPSLGTYFLAVQFLDLLWPTLLLLHVEKVEITGKKGLPLNFISYPISHSLAMVLLWGLLFSVLYWLFKKETKSAIVLGLCVVSHWVLDLIVHIPDLPLYPGKSPLFGLGLWKSITASLIVELLLFVSGIFLYLTATKASNKAGSIGFWSLAIFLLVIHIANMFGAPPSNVKAIAWAGQLQWLFVIWAYWIDRNRHTADTSIAVNPKKAAIT